MKVAANIGLNEKFKKEGLYSVLSNLSQFDESVVPLNARTTAAGSLLR